MITSLSLHRLCLQNLTKISLPQISKRTCGIVILSITVFASYFPLRQPSVDYLLQLAKNLGELVCMQLRQAMNQLKDLEKWINENLKMFSRELSLFTFLLAIQSLFPEKVFIPTDKPSI